MLSRVPAAQRIESFLAKHPDGALTVCVGYASVAGIAWLADHMDGRGVYLLIGDLKGQHFEKATQADRAKAHQFVSRNNVHVYNWYRTERSDYGRSSAHLKVWAVEPADINERAYLVGSANLTNAGLYQNVEAMATAQVGDHDYLHALIRGLSSEAWDKKERLLGLIRPDDAPGHEPLRAPSRTHQRTRLSTPRPPSANTGCGAQVLTVAAVAGAATALLVKTWRRLQGH